MSTECDTQCYFFAFIAYMAIITLPLILFLIIPAWMKMRHEKKIILVINQNQKKKKRRKKRKRLVQKINKKGLKCVHYYDRPDISDD